MPPSFSIDQTPAAQTTLQKQFDGLTFRMSQLPAWHQFEVLHRLVTLLGPGMRAVAPAVKGLKGGAGGVAAAKMELAGGFLEAVPELLQRCTMAELRQLSEQLLSTMVVTVGGKNAQVLEVFDTIFQGKLTTMFKVLYWAIGGNFSDFFSLWATAESRVAKEPTPATTP